MNKKYLEKIVPRVFNDYLEMLHEDIVEGLPKNAGNFFAELSTGTFRVLGVCEYLINKDVVKLKNYFYNAAVAAKRTLEIYDEEIDVRPTIGISMMNFRALYCAIISENTDVIMSFAELMGGRDEVEKELTTKHVYNLGYALKYMTLSKYKMAQGYIEHISKYSSHTFNFGLYEILNGIITEDKDSINKGLDKRLQYYRRSKQFKDTPEEFLSIEIIALAKLAKMKSLEIKLDNDLAPMKIINYTDVNYSLHDIMNLKY